MATRKRLIVACDGTWVNSDNGWVRNGWLPWNRGGTLATPSNVTRLCRAIETRSKDGIQQIVYYQGGLGTADNWYSHYIGGYFGQGISENIREAYVFICNNYEPGDEIILTGFSRGAFTARSVGGLISAVGLLTKRGLSAFYPIFKDWENQTKKGFKPIPHHNLDDDIHHPSRPTFKNKKYLDMLVSRELTRPDIPIKAIGVWDTVGSLGVPTVKLFGFSIHTDSTMEYSFVNTEVAPNVEHAYQALALDEVRSPFAPTVWESPDPANPILKELKQTWFPGAHSNVGGGTSDSSISDITLAWMMTQLSKHITFDPEYIPRQRDQNEAFYGSIGVPVRPWAMGLLSRKDGGLIGALQGRTTRTPGAYHPTNPDTGKPLPRMLTQTHEFIHPCVRYRHEQGGHNAVTGKDDSQSGVYDALALRGWKFLKGTDAEADKYGGTEWKGRNKWIKPDGSGLYIVEDQIREDTPEMALLQGWRDEQV